MEAEMENKGTGKSSEKLAPGLSKVSAADKTSRSKVIILQAPMSEIFISTKQQ
ncbi:hypothetical protein ACSS6W_002312 [Trichoderma asperelloides]